MKELIANLVSQANLSEEQAKQAADVVRNFLSARLPEAIRGPVESALTGENVDGAVDTARNMLGGLFGGKE
jgi:hypothetical protein